MEENNDNPNRTATPAADMPPNNGDGNGKLKHRRRMLLSAILGSFLIACAGYGVYWDRIGRYTETTDDAYVAGHVVQITPEIAGTVVAIDADNTQYVHAGQTLVRLDKADARIALAHSEAQLAKTVRQVRNMFATSAQLKATVAQRRAELDRARQDLSRRKKLGLTGAIASEAVQHAQDDVATAQAAYEAAQRQLDANRALIDHTTVQDHPDVRAAAAEVRKDWLNLRRTSLPAPVSGFVARRSVQLGQQVSAGTSLMAVVPLNEVWVDANFKEGQLENMRFNQPVKVTADLYGDGVVYHGRVIGFGAGTGAAFALLPAQNATGNWIKVVQRVPVRIALNPKELAAHPLQIGLSLNVVVDTHDRGGTRLPMIAKPVAGAETDVFKSSGTDADKRIAAIIAANAGPSATVAKAQTGGASHSDAHPEKRPIGPAPRTAQAVALDADPR
jgi:membrane fusion protein (multidrug efflux system)